MPVSSARLDLSHSVDAVLVALRERRPAVECVSLLNRALDHLGAWSTTDPHGVGMLGVDGAPDWYHQEIYAWEFCQQLGKLAKPRFRRNEAFVEVLKRVIEMPAVGKGRQAFALLATDLGGAEVATWLAGCLHDEELSAVVLERLAKYRVPGFEDAAQVMSGRSHPRDVQRAARKYLKTLPS